MYAAKCEKTDPKNSKLHFECCASPKHVYLSVIQSARASTHFYTFRCMHNERKKGKQREAKHTPMVTKIITERTILRYIDGRVQKTAERTNEGRMLKIRRLSVSCLVLVFVGDRIY